jgi:hypothetical protein
MGNNTKITLLQLYGIERGYLQYLPASIPAVRDVTGMIKDIFNNTLTHYDINGKRCLHKSQIMAGIHRRVIKALGNKCIACGRAETKGMHVHHIKYHWRTWNNAFGFTVLCEDCHRIAQYGGSTKNPCLLLGINVKDFCKKIMSPECQEYEPPGKVYPECTAYKVARFYYSLD